MQPLKGYKMKFLREIAKIAEWGLKGDVTRVSAYVQQLAEKLRAEGDQQAASYLRDLLNKSVVLAETSAIQSQMRLPVDTESRLALADEDAVGPGQVPIILDEATNRVVDEFINFVQKADQLEAHGVGIAPSLITYGPPGSGKTHLARYIASRLGFPLVTARADTLISSFLGSTSKNLRQLFDHVSHRHCILFLDELDAFAKLRDDAQEMGELKRVVVSLLQNIDALDRATVVLAATNHEHLLDPAIWRRFTYKIPLPLPAAAQRLQLFDLFLGKYAQDVDKKLLSVISTTLSGADIRSLTETAIREAVIANRESVNENGLVWRIIRFRLKQEISADPSSAQLRAVRDLAPEHLNGIRLAAIFNTSRSTISRKLHKVGEV